MTSDEGTHKAIIFSINQNPILKHMGEVSHEAILHLPITCGDDLISPIGLSHR